MKHINKVCYSRMNACSRSWLQFRGHRTYCSSFSKNTYHSGAWGVWLRTYPGDGAVIRNVVVSRGWELGLMVSRKDWDIE